MKTAEVFKERGDYVTDTIEAMNMKCFTMRVHSNLFESVPNKTQTSNKDDNKHELIYKQ